MNLLTNEFQCAFKNSSAQDFISPIKNKMAKTKYMGQILLDLSRAFGRINRNQLWLILYEKGLPKNTITMLIDAHINTTLRCRHDGKLGPEVINNIGVFQGSPLSPQLFAVFADKVMGNYTNETTKANL